VSTTSTTLFTITSYLFAILAMWQLWHMGHRKEFEFAGCHSFHFPGITTALHITSRHTTAITPSLSKCATRWPLQSIAFVTFREMARLGKTCDPRLANGNGKEENTKEGEEEEAVMLTS
jgi:hypothetical protein